MLRPMESPLADPHADPQGVGRRIAAASDERRRHVERVLHDGVQQHLALLGLKLSMLQKLISTDPAGAEELCAELRQEIQSALAELRNVALLVYPALLDNEGLSAALRRAASRLPVTVAIDVEERFPTPAELVAPLYFCVVETIELVAPYAREPMLVTVLAGDDEISIELDAPAADVSADVLEHGMGYIIDRVTALGGVVTLKPAGSGIKVTGMVPVRSTAARA